MLRPTAADDEHEEAAADDAMRVSTLEDANANSRVELGEAEADDARRAETQSKQ